MGKQCTCRDNRPRIQKYPGILYTKYLTKTGTTYRRATQQKYRTNLSIPEHIVTLKEGAQTSKQCTGRDNLPRIQIPGNTMHKTSNKKQVRRTDGQHKCQNHRKNWFISGTHESGIKRSRLQLRVRAPKNHMI
jgi:hypothetical protein